VFEISSAKRPGELGFHILPCLLMKEKEPVLETFCFGKTRLTENIRNQSERFIYHCQKAVDLVQLVQT
jgi:hypothetical protein